MSSVRQPCLSSKVMEESNGFSVDACNVLNESEDLTQESDFSAEFNFWTEKKDVKDDCITMSFNLGDFLAQGYSNSKNVVNLSENYEVASNFLDDLGNSSSEQNVSVNDDKLDTNLEQSHFRSSQLENLNGSKQEEMTIYKTKNSERFLNDNYVATSKQINFEIHAEVSEIFKRDDFVICKQNDFDTCEQDDLKTQKLDDEETLIRDKSEAYQKVDGFYLPDDEEDNQKAFSELYESHPIEFPKTKDFDSRQNFGTRIYTSLLAKPGSKEGLPEDENSNITDKQLRNPEFNKYTKDEYNCTELDFQTNTKTQVDNHQATHITKSMCEICNFIGNIKDLRKHYLADEKSSIRKCCKCDYTAKQRVNVIKHAMKKHGVVIKERTLKCKVCSFKTDALIKLKHHVKTHIKQSSYLCDHCGFKVIGYDCFMTHKMIHSKESNEGTS